MRHITAHRRSIVLILTRAEAKALKMRLFLHTGVKKSKPSLKVEEKLLVELGEI